MNTKISDLETQLEEAHEAKAEAFHSQRRAEHQLELDHKDLELLRQHLDSYKLESKNLMSDYNSQKDERIGQLETLVQEYKENVANLQTQLQDEQHKQERLASPSKNENNLFLERHLTEEIQKNEKLREGMLIR